MIRSKRSFRFYTYTFICIFVIAIFVIGIIQEYTKGFGLLILLIYAIPSVASFVLRKHKLLTFLPPLLLFGVVTIIINLIPEDTQGHGFIPFLSFRSLTLFFFYAAVVLNFVVSVILYFYNKMAENDRKKLKKLEKYERDNFQWECPQCGGINPNNSYVCDNCGYKVI